MEKRSIVLIRFPFTDLTEIKLRPALVLNKMGEDLVCVFISSREAGDSEDLFILKTDENQLKMNSWIKCHKIFTLHISLVERSLGKLEEKIHQEVLNRLHKALF